MTTPKQQRANRKNAKKGGVKTDAGKAISKRNAVKHGILSEHILITKGDTKEEIAAYDVLKQSLITDLKPNGALEMMLTEKLVALYWRTCRLMRAEKALAEKELIGHSVRQNIERMQRHCDTNKFFGGRLFELLMTSHGCSQLQQGMELVCIHIEDQGLPLETEEAQKAIFAHKELGEQFPDVERIVWLHCLSKTNPNDDEFQQGRNKDALEAAKRMTQYFANLAKTWRVVEEQQDTAIAEAYLLPSIEDLERLQRYEAHLHRCFTQTLHELQRVQAMRKEGVKSTVAALDVNINSENGFVS